MKTTIVLVFVAAVSAVVTPAATFTTVNVANYLNSNVQFNPSTFPTGITYGNQGANVPFDISLYHGIVGNWAASLNSPQEKLDVKLDVAGATTFYALLNNGFGTPGANEYDLSFEASNGNSITYQSIGGVDTRDYNQNYFTNTISGTTTPFFNNGLGQRMDMRKFSLPASFANDTITDFVITQISPSDNALFWGLTYASGVTPTPEPLSLTLTGAGILALGIVRRSKRLRMSNILALGMEQK